jgi:hypothetical protein
MLYYHLHDYLFETVDVFAFLEEYWGHGPIDETMVSPEEIDQTSKGQVFVCYMYRRYLACLYKISLIYI